MPTDQVRAEGARVKPGQGVFQICATALRSPRHQEARMLSPQQIEAYHRDGFSFPHKALSAAELAECRDGLARYETWLGKPVNHGDWRWRSQAYAFLPWLDRLI